MNEQEPQDQLQRQHRNVRKIKKYKQQTKKHTEEVPKITPKNKCLNNVIPFTEKFVNCNISLNISIAPFKKGLK